MKKPSRWMKKLPRWAHARARRLVESPGELRRVIEKAQRKQESARMVKRVLAKLRTMLDLIKAWVRGEYSDVSKANLVLIVGAVVYFLVPIDLIPDFFAGFGLVDDAAVISWVVAAVTNELEKFEVSRPTDRESAGQSRGVDSCA